MMKIPISLPCLFHSEASMALKELDIESEDHEVEEILFYRIEAISPMKAGDKTQSCIYANGTDYTCVLHFDKVKLMIEKWLTENK